MSHYGCDREAAKQLFLSMLNTGTAYGWQLNELKRSEAELLPPPAFVAEFSQEMKLMQHFMLERHPEALEQARGRLSNQGASTGELRASAFSIALQTYENKALHAVESCINDAAKGVFMPSDGVFDNRVVDGLIFDGAAVRLENDLFGAPRTVTPLEPELLQACNDAIEAALPGFKLRVVEKPFKACPIGAAWVESAKSRKDIVTHAVNSIYDKAWDMISAMDVGLGGFE